MVFLEEMPAFTFVVLLLLSNNFLNTRSDIYLSSHGTDMF